MFYKGNEDREKRLRFSIRKVSFGAASVAVAALFMFPGNGTVSATEQGVTPTNEGTQSSPLKDPDVQNGTYGATPVVSQLDGNSGSSETTAPKAQADTTTPTPVDSSSTSVESAPVSKVQDETPASTPVDESVASATPAPASVTEESGEKATSDLDKKQLEDYVSKIDAKLASGSYATKTDESVATLKEHLELAKLALTTAKSQDELTKAYRRLFTTVNSGLRSKPKAQVESPKLDTTEGKATVGKKASNTERATGSNSIANSGKHDPRNGQALDRNNPFRIGEATTDTDPAAHQVFEGTSADDSVEDLSKKLRALDDTVENNKKVSEELDSLGAATGVAKGTVQNINEFGGWTAITDSEGKGKFAIARKTDKGVFPLETINTVRNINSNVTKTYLREQALDRTADYMLFLSEVRTKVSENEPTFNGQAYQESGLGRGLAYGLKGYNGIQKTFKAYSPDSGSKVKITFKTGYSGDIDGTKAKYRVQVFTSASSTNPVYDVTFDPQSNTTNADMTVLKSSDGSSVTREFIQGRVPLNKQSIEDQMAQAGYIPNGVAGKFTSREIELPAGVTDYTVKISSADNDRLGMGYQALHRHYALPISGLDFHVTQDTGEVAKELLKKIYLKLKETEEKDKTFKTAESQKNYEAELQKVSQLLNDPTKSASDYKDVLTDVLIKKQELANSSQEASIKSNATDEIDKAVATKIQAIEGNAKLSEADKAKAKDAVTAAANAAKVAIVAAQNPAEVTEKEAAGKQAISAVPEVGKEQAKSEIDKAAAAKIQAIEGNAKLSEADKAKAKEAVRTAADTAKSEIEQAADQTAVDAKETAGKQAISDVAEVGKEQAKSEIDKAAAAKIQAIEGNAKLSEADKAKAKLAVKDAADAAKSEIEQAADQTAVDAKEAAGKQAISAVPEVGKEQAKSEIDKAAAAKIQAIEGNAKLSEADKAKAKEAVRTAADAAKSEIEQAADQTAVDAKEAAGKQAISDVAEVGKEQAKSEIDKAAAAKIQAIEGNAKLSEAEKSVAKAAAKKVAEDAKKAIEASTSQAEVDSNVTKGTDSISSVAEVGKDQAKAAIDSALSDKETVIDSNAKLSEAEKSAAKAEVKKAADEAKKAIDAATTQAEVDRILRNDIYKDDAAINEVESFDLSSLLVNGFVSVTQGETLTDQEVLSKVNLPKDVEVIKVEKPTTSALGRLVAKVTLKLSDGSVEEINVPVEVVAPQNHGNEGNGANNGSTNTEAKVNKAKLEAAIHQLDEFKFDAETAKEANALSADAKKVFANADASQDEVDAMVKRIEDFMAKVAPSTDHTSPAKDQATQTPAVAPATTQAAANASQEATNARKAAKELPNTGTADSTVAMVAAAASALLGLGLAGRRRKEDEEA